MKIKHLQKFITVFILLILLIIANFATVGLDDVNSEPDPDLEDSNTTTTEAHNSVPRSTGRALNDWTMHLYGPTHNSYTTSTGPTDASILWWNTTGDTTYSSPCVANGRVFLGVGNSMKCYFENNGTLNWTLSPINVAGGYGVCSSPAYANGCIYFGADQIYCVWATNGTIRWTVNKLNIKHGDGSPTLAYGKVFITGSDYKLYCIDQITGNVYWTFQTQNNLPSPPIIPDNWGLYAAPAVVNGRVFLAACDWNLYQINVTQPTSIATANHTFTMGHASYSSPVVVGDKVYVGCSYITKLSTARFYCFWASNLTKIWEFYPDSYTGFFSSAGYYNDRIYVGSIDGMLYCLNSTTGTQVWNYTIGGTWSSPAVTAERLYIGSKTGYLYCFNTTQPLTPEYYWRYQITGEVDASPSVVPGRVYIGTHGGGGKIYCFGTKDNIPPQVTSNYPASGATDVPVTIDINVTFNEPVNPNSLTASSFKVMDSALNPVAGQISYDPITRTALFDPDTALQLGEVYTVTVTTGVQDHWANSLDGNKNNVQDGSPVDDHSWSFTTSTNNPPALTNPMVAPTIGYITTDFKFKVVYTDLDNDTPEINPAYIQVFIDDEIIGRAMSLNLTAPSSLRDGDFINGEEYIYSTTFSTYGLHSYKFGCFDGIDQNETLSYDEPLIVAKPVFDPIGELNAHEDINLTLTLGDKIQDEDTNLTELILTVNSTYATIDELNITFNYPNEFNYPSGRDYELVAINVSDNIHNISQEVKVNVFAVNDAPEIKGVPNLQVNEGEYLDLDVTPYLSDVDNELDALLVFAKSSYATVSEKNITFYYPIDSGIVSEYVEIRVFDGELDGTQDIIVAVIPEGSYFVLLQIFEQNAVEDIDLVVDMADYISTYGDLTLDEFVLELNSSYCTISGTELVFNYPNEFNYPSGRIYELVQVKVSYEDQTESIDFKVNVLPVNDGPILTVIEAPVMALASTTLKFEAEYFDVDGGENPIVKVIIDGTEYTLAPNAGNIHGEGATYDTELELTVGNYKYYYSADDVENEINSVYQTNLYNLKIVEYSEYGDDTDGDSIPDAWELTYDLDPFDPSDASEDPDKDTYTNLAEFLGADGIAGGGDSSNPQDSAELPVEVQPGDEKGADSRDDESAMWGWLALVIIVIIVVIIVAIFLLMKRTKKAAPGTTEEGYVPSYYAEPPPATVVAQPAPPQPTPPPMAQPVLPPEPTPEAASEEDEREEE